MEARARLWGCSEGRGTSPSLSLDHLIPFIHERLIRIWTINQGILLRETPSCLVLGSFWMNMQFEQLCVAQLRSLIWQRLITLVGKRATKSFFALCKGCSSHSWAAIKKQKKNSNAYIWFVYLLFLVALVALSCFSIASIWLVLVSLGTRDYPRLLCPLHAFDLLALVALSPWVIFSCGYIRLVYVLLVSPSSPCCPR